MRADVALVLAALGLVMAAPAGLAKSVAPADPDAFVEAPTAIVSDTVAQVIVILNQVDTPSSRRRAQIEELAFATFDFPTMSKLVLARNWKKFDDAQRAEFIRQFKLYLSRNYGSRLDRYQQTDVAIVGSRIEPRNDVTVLSKVVGGEFDGIEMNYRLRERRGEWKVIDVVIEGVSLIANFRSQFREIVSQKGPDGLLEQMRKKNAEPIEEDASVS